MIGRGRSSECRVHASALVDLVDPYVATPATTAAMDHLEWCDECSAELQDLALTIVALRRFGSASIAEPLPPAAWPRLAGRIQETRAAAVAAAWRWRASVAGLVTGALIVAAVVGPSALNIQVAGGVNEPTGLTTAQIDALAWRAEANYILQSGIAGPFDAPSAATASATSPRRYPDDIIPLRKEVPVRTTGLSPKAD